MLKILLGYILCSIRFMAFSISITTKRHCGLVLARFFDVLSNASLGHSDLAAGRSVVVVRSVSVFVDLLFGESASVVPDLVLVELESVGEPFAAAILIALDWQVPVLLLFGSLE